MAAAWRGFGGGAGLPKNEPKTATLAAKKTQPACRIAGQASKRWNYD
jgi:hypothetical protein